MNGFLKLTFHEDLELFAAKDRNMKRLEELKNIASVDMTGHVAMQAGNPFAESFAEFNLVAHYLIQQGK